MPYNATGHVPVVINGDAAAASNETNLNAGDEVTINVNEAASAAFVAVLHFGVVEYLDAVTKSDRVLMWIRR